MTYYSYINAIKRQVIKKIGKKEKFAEQLLCSPTKKLNIVKVKNCGNRLNKTKKTTTHEG